MPPALSPTRTERATRSLLTHQKPWPHLAFRAVRRYRAWPPASVAAQGQGERPRRGGLDPLPWGVRSARDGRLRKPWRHALPCERELALLFVPVYRRNGREVYYGNATNELFLRSCGLMDAKAVVITIGSQAAIDAIVVLVRRLRPDILIVSCARDAGHASHLYEIGVTDAVPETIEASLQLSEATLIGLGMQAGPVIASIHGKRDEFRIALQSAAGQAGLQTIHSIRRKTLRRSWLQG